MNALHFVSKGHLVVGKGISVVFVRVEGDTDGPIRVHDLVLKSHFMFLLHLDGKRSVVKLRDHIVLEGFS